MTICWFIYLLDELSRFTVFSAPLFLLLTGKIFAFFGFWLLKGSAIRLIGGRVLRLGTWFVKLLGADVKVGLTYVLEMVSVLLIVNPSDSINLSIISLSVCPLFLSFSTSLATGLLRFDFWGGATLGGVLSGSSLSIEYQKSYDLIVEENKGNFF